MDQERSPQNPDASELSAAELQDFYFANPTGQSRPLFHSDETVIIHDRELPSYEDVVPVPLYEEVDPLPLVIYDDVPITSYELALASSGFNWVYIILTDLLPTTIVTPEPDWVFPLIDLPHFFDVVGTDARVNPPQDAVRPTAFPRLGEEHTCDCWNMLGGPFATRPIELYCMRTLFAEYKSIGGIALLDHLGRESREVTVRDHRRHYLTYVPQPCGCGKMEYSSATTCHMTVGVGFDGHDVTHHASINGAYNNNGKFIINNIHCHDTRGAIMREGLNDNHLPPCHHRAHLRDEVYKGPVVAGYIPLSRRLVSSTEQVDRKYLHNDWADEYYGLLEIRIRTYQSQFGSRTIGADWHECVASVTSLWYQGYPEGADQTVVQSGDITLPRCVKRRYKSLSSKLARAAMAYGGKIKIDKSFEAATYQEWYEMDLQRYELAASMSNTDIVRSCNQTAQLWLRTADAKHRLNRVVRASSAGSEDIDKELSKFNFFFVNIIGGKPLKLPQQLIESARKSLERSAELKAKQLAASQARVYVRGYGMMSKNWAEQNGCLP